MFDTASGSRLFYRYWKHEGDRLANILCIHGLCCDSRIFDYTAKNLASLGYDVYAIDLPGYANSEGERGDYPFDDTTNCINDFVIELKKQDGQLFVLGFSLGGLHALWYAYENPEQLDGLILLAPLLKVKGIKTDKRTEPSTSTLILSIIKNLVTPKAKIDLSKAIPRAFSAEASKELAHMVNEPTCNFTFSYRYVFETLLKRPSMVEKLSKVNLPALILQGDEDFLVVPEQSRAFMRMLQSSDKQLEILQGSDHWFYHALFYVQDPKYTDSQRIQVINTIHEWVSKRVRHAKAADILS